MEQYVDADRGTQFRKRDAAYFIFKYQMRTLLHTGEMWTGIIEEAMAINAGRRLVSQITAV